MNFFLMRPTRADYVGEKTECKYSALSRKSGIINNNVQVSTWKSSGWLIIATEIHF